MKFDATEVRPPRIPRLTSIRNSQFEFCNLANSAFRTPNSHSKVTRLVHSAAGDKKQLRRPPSPHLRTLQTFPTLRPALTRLSHNNPCTTFLRSCVHFI